MRVIGDSSPLIIYAKAGMLSLLRDVFSEVTIPPAVQQEVIRAQPSLTDAIELSAADWLRTLPLSNPERLNVLPPYLGSGEAEVIALAEETTRPVTVILDDFQARRYAVSRGLGIVGSAGVLVLAKRLSIVSAVAPYLASLTSAGLYLGPRHVNQILTIAGETGTDQSK